MRVWFLALALAASGCARWMDGYVLFPNPRRPASPGWAQVQVDRVRFDGEYLDFRLLVGAVDGGVLLDRRLVDNADVEIRETVDCDGGMPLRHIFADFMAAPPEASDFLELAPGSWFGAEKRFLLFIGQEDGGALPSCVDATFLLRLEVAANPTVVFHVQGSQSPPEPDGGTPADGGGPDSPLSSRGAHPNL